MPKSPQDIYARHLLSPRGYPLWTPEPSHQLLAYRPDGLRIGDVGVVIPEDGCFDVFFNVCLPHDHPFHQATGVPDNFKPIKLDDIDIRTVTNAENPGRIIATSSVKTIRTMERSGDTLSRTQSSGLGYEFNLSSSEGALLILPEGAERHDLRNHHRFLEAATRHGADWYRFAEEKVGQIIGHDSLYLITGLYKSRSWSLAAFEKTAESGEYPAQFRISQVGGDNIAAAGTWDTTRSLDWRVGPIDNYGIPNQSVFIRGFKIAHRTGMFGTRWISVKADAPSTRPNPVMFSSAIPGESWLAYIFGGLSTGGTTEPSRSGMRDDIAADPVLDAARNEIQNNGALAVGEHVVIQRMPEVSQAFHPSDIINQYLLNKEPSANIAVTHDNEWTALLEQNLLRPESFVQEGLLETLVSQKYHIISEAGAVYLRSRNSHPGTSDASTVDATMDWPEPDSESPIITAVDTNPFTEQEDVGAPRATEDANQSPNSSRINESISPISLDPQSGKVVLDSEEPLARNESPSLQNPNSSTSHCETPPEMPHEQKGSRGTIKLRMRKDRPTSLSSVRPYLFPSDPSTLLPPVPQKPSRRGPDHARHMASQSHDKIPQVDGVFSAQPELHHTPWTHSYTHQTSPNVASYRIDAPSVQSASLKVVEDTIKLNPLLSGSPNGRDGYARWNMCFPARQYNFGITTTQSWVEALNAPATEPHQRHIFIISREFPGSIYAHAKDPESGVRCEDVLDAIYEFLNDDMLWEEYERFGRERYKVTAEVGKGTLKRSHWLGSKWFFGGVVENDAFVTERYNEPRSSTTLELVCLSS